jgi:hypothetical protein
MLAYHADPAIKTRYLARVEGHAAADEIVKGQYWEAGKGCAVGCTIHGTSHENFEQELGIPQMLAWLEDVIFEGLPNRAAKTWPERFLTSIEPGKDLSRVGWQFLHWLLTDSGFGDPDHPTVKDAVTRCADALVPLMNGQPADPNAANDAAAIARAAAANAESAAPSLWIVESAAQAAESAALSATNPAASAERAATAASAAIARSADYVTVSEKLLDLLTAPSFDPWLNLECASSR